MTTETNTPSNWQVVRDCCTSGNCLDCHGKTPFGQPMRVVQADNLTEPRARKIARGWHAYRAAAELMPAAAGKDVPQYTMHQSRKPLTVLTGVSI